MSRKEHIAFAKKFNERFIRENRALVTYVRSYTVPDLQAGTKGRPFGCFVAFRDADGVMHYGWSFVHPKKEIFTKPIGLYKAIQRSLGVRDRQIPQQHKAIFDSFQEVAVKEIAGRPESVTT